MQTYNKSLNNLFISVLQKLIIQKEENGSLDINKFKDIFYGFNDETNLFPSDEQLKEAIHNATLSNQVSKEILYCIALYQRYNELNDVMKLSSSSYSVEHILPKQWEQNWLTKEMNEIEKNERSKKLMTLGNLTLITKKLNSKLKNSSWMNKREALKNHSSLKLTTNYLDLDNWDEKTIENRAKDLFNLAVNMWPRENKSFANLDDSVIKVKKVIMETANDYKKINTKYVQSSASKSTKSTRLNYEILPEYFGFSKNLEGADKFELVATMRVKDIIPKPDCNEKKGDLIKRLRQAGMEKALDLKGIKNPEELRDFLDKKL